MGIPDHLTCLLRNLCAGQKATVRTRHGTMDWFKMGKGVRQGYILSPCLFNLYEEYIMRNSGLDESQAGIKIARRNTNNLRYADDTTLNGREWRGTKEPLDECEGGEWKKLAWNSTFKKLKIVASCPITSWQVQFSCSVVSQLFAIPWTAACQASLSITNSQSLPKPVSIESVMPSNHFILCRPLLLLPSVFPSIRVFSSESVLHIR